MNKQKTILLFFFLSLFFLSQAQHMNVERFYHDVNDLEARTYSGKREDPSAPGNYCALVKVQLVIPNAQFEGYTVGDIRYEMSEYKIYMSQGTKKLKVRAPGYLPCEINFSDFGIERLEGMNVYYAVINAGKETLAKEQAVEIKVNPADAVIIIDSKNEKQPQRYYLDSEGERRTLSLPLGDYNYSAIANGYNRVEGGFSLSETSRLILPIEMVPKEGYIRKEPVPAITPVSDTATKEKVERNASHFSFYIAPVAITIDYFAIGEAIGINLHRVNMELSYLQSLSASEMITWQKPTGEDYGAYTYKPAIVNFRIGYDVIDTKHFAVTPRLGYSILKAAATYKQGNPNLVADGTNSQSILADVKLSCKISNHVGIYLAPQYGIRVARTEAYSLMANVSSKMNHWNNSFGLSLGLSATFNK